MKTLHVELGARRYPIHIGPGLLGEAACLRPVLAGRQVLVISNERVAPLYLPTVTRLLEGLTLRTLVLPDGEQYKTLASAERIFDLLLEAGFNRDCTLLALGGGVIGDLTGFAAACYQRGVAFVQLPTTLLAQVDASVGGKTAVNHPRGKNMIGAFHQPRAVLIDTDTLHSLPEREFSAGLAEVIKYGIIADADFFAWLEDHLDALRERQTGALGYAIERSCVIKAAIVAADEREAGRRALLNLGHTFGHAIETALGYGAWLHGEAVGAGLVLAGRAARRLGWLEETALERITRLCRRAGLPTEAPHELDPERLLELMRGDKKVLDGRLRLVLPRGIGAAELTDALPETELRAVLAG